MRLHVSISKRIYIVCIYIPIIGSLFVRISFCMIVLYFFIIFLALFFHLLSNSKKKATKREWWWRFISKLLILYTYWLRKRASLIILASENEILPQTKQCIRPNTDDIMNISRKHNQYLFCNLNKKINFKKIEIGLKMRKPFFTF